MRWNTIVRFVAGVAGTACIVYGIERIQALPSFPARTLKCANCWLAATVMPVETAALGVLLVWMSFLGVRFLAKHVFAFAMLVAGIVFTPILIGVPLFALGLGMLAFAFIPALFRTLGTFVARR